MKYPSNFSEMIRSNNCRAAYIQVNVTRYERGCYTPITVADIFEPLDVNYSIDVAEAIAKPFVKRLCELHPEWQKMHINAYVNVSNACHGEMRTIWIPTIWHEITGKW